MKSVFSERDHSALHLVPKFRGGKERDKKQTTSLSCSPFDEVGKTKRSWPSEL